MFFDPNFMLDTNDTDPAAEQRNEHGQPIAPAPSASIPLPSSHVTRTQSEVQLAIDQEAAELRDAAMFYRLVNGIRARQHSCPYPSQDPNMNPSLASIIQTHSSDAYDASKPSVPQSRMTAISAVTAGLVTAPIPTHPLTLQHQAHSVATEDDGWSISGFEQQQQHAIHQPMYPYTLVDTVQEQQDDDEDEGIFDLEM